MIFKKIISAIFGSNEKKEELKRRDIEAISTNKNSETENAKTDTCIGESASEDAGVLCDPLYLKYTGLCEFQHLTDSREYNIPPLTDDYNTSFRAVIEDVWPEMKSALTNKVKYCFSTDHSTSNTLYTDGNVLDLGIFDLFFKLPEIQRYKSLLISAEYKDKENNCHWLQLIINGYALVHNTCFARLTLMRPHEGVDNLHTAVSQCNPVCESFMLRYELGDTTKPKAYYMQVLDTLTEKRKENKELTTEEKVLYDGILETEPLSSYYISALQLFKVQRYYDAYIKFQHYYNWCKPVLHKVNKNYILSFYDTCFFMAQCLIQLGIDDRPRICALLGMAVSKQQKYTGFYIEYLADFIDKKAADFLSRLVAKKDTDEKARKDYEQLSPIYNNGVSNWTIPAEFKTGSVTIGQTLNCFFSLSSCNVLRLNYQSYSDEKKALNIDEQTADFQKKIWDTNLLEFKSDGICFIQCSCTKWADTDDKSENCPDRFIILSLSTVESKDGNSYRRIDIMMPNCINDDDKHLSTGIANTPVFTSFIVSKYCSADKYTKDNLMDLFHYGLTLRNDGRYFEAMLCNEYIHRCLKSKVNDESQLTQEEGSLFYTCTFNVGYCLMEFELFEPAQYYLQYAFNIHDVDFSREYINCLCNSKDMRAIEVVDEEMQMVKPHIHLKDHPELATYYEFLQRRKVFILIDREIYSEAEVLLNEMLNNPHQRDYAQNELNYLHNKLK